MCESNTLPESLEKQISRTCLHIKFLNKKWVFVAMPGNAALFRVDVVGVRLRGEVTHIFLKAMPLSLQTIKNNTSSLESCQFIPHTNNSLNPNNFEVTFCNILQILCLSVLMNHTSSTFYKYNFGFYKRRYLKIAKEKRNFLI